MKQSVFSLARCLSVVAMLFVSTSVLRSQDATWNNGAGGNWNDDANWDVLLTPGELTNAILPNAFGSYVVDYSTPMTATSIGSLFITSNNVNRVTLNVNTNGFIVAGNITMQRGAGMVVGQNGVVSASTIRLHFANNSAFLNMLPGSSLTASTLLALADQGNIAGATLTNYGGNITAASTRIGGGQDAGPLLVMGGVNDLGDFAINRCGGNSTTMPGLNTGLIVSNGLVTANGMVLGNNNSWGNITLAGGVITNAGETILARQLTANRGGRFTQLGGLFVSSTVRMCVNNESQIASYAVLGGTNIVDGFVMGDAIVFTSTSRLTNSSLIYIGSGGITSDNFNAGKNNTIVLNAGGIFGANADWTGTEGISLNGGSFNAASLSGTPHNITLSGVLTGGGALTKTGGGVLTLGNANTFTGNTIVNQGTLALGASGSIANSPQILLASGTLFDVSASGGFTVNASRTLAGSGMVIGDVTVTSGGIINPGTSPGTLTLSNSLALNGGASLDFELPTTPGPGNDRLVVKGDLNVSGNNTFNIVGGGSAGTVHTLIQYEGNFNGTVQDFIISGATGIISNNPTFKTIALVVQSTVRAATNVVWVGNASANDWNTLDLTNWLNTGTASLDYFVPADNAIFNNNGAANPNVNIVGTVMPTTVTVDSTSDYSFSGSGSIGGNASLTKTNSAKLTISALNSYIGPTIIGGGVLEVAELANSGSPSPIGASSSSSGNLVIGSGILSYTGPTISIDRSATMSSASSKIAVSGNGDLTLSGELVGSGGLTKIGDGTLILTGNNGYQGNTVLSNGTLQVGTTASAIANTVVFAGGTWSMNVSGQTTYVNPLDVLTTGTINSAGGNNNIVQGPWSGAGTLDLRIASGTFTINADMTPNFTGTIRLTDDSVGTLRFNAGGNSSGAQQSTGSATATFDLGQGSASLLNRNGGAESFGNYFLGALAGGPNTFLRGAGNGSSASIYHIGNKNLDTTFEGTIADGTGGGIVSVVKEGTGKLTLSGNNTYAGATVVNGGELQVNGFNNSSSNLVQSGTLSGTGDFLGTMQVDPGATLSPGTSIGNMTLNNSLTLNGNLVIEVNTSEAPASDTISLGGPLSGSGTITVSNLGPALVFGHKFYPFNGVPVAGASALTVSGAGVAWINNIETDGSIEVSAPISEPTFGNITRSGNNIIINGSGGPTSGNYIVLASTNIATAISAWTPILTNPFNPDGTFSITNTIVPGTPRLFYTIQIE